MFVYVSCRSGTEENTYGIILAILIQIFLIASQINITVYASMNDMGSKRACTATGSTQGDKEEVDKEDGYQ